MNNLYPLMADMILIVHFAFIVFILAGQVCVVVGHFRSWHWVRNVTFRVCHILAMGIVVVQAWAEQVCPLTLWENALRQTAGGQPYKRTFVEHWVGRLVYYDAPQWIFTVVYSLFGAVVLCSWIWISPERDRHKKMSGGDSK
jgi:hypothetical protein